MKKNKKRFYSRMSKLIKKCFDCPGSEKQVENTYKRKMRKKYETL